MLQSQWSVQLKQDYILFTNMNIPNETQEGKVLNVLKQNEGQWVNKQYFIRDLYLTQAGRAIHNLENKLKWKVRYLGYQIEHSPFTDEFGFKSFRLIKKSTLF